MQQRTRTLIPVLPQLITAAEDQLGRAARLLTAVRKAEPASSSSSTNCAIGALAARAASGGPPRCS
jgi:hypothetical protein